MHVISKARLRDFWTIHPRAKSSLEQWFYIAKKAKWKSFADVRASFSTADWFDPYVIFDIGGNKYRLIVHIHFNTRKVYVRYVLTHADYSRDDWKNE